MLDYPRVSPHLLACRQAVRGLPGCVIGVSGGPDSLALAAACAIEGVDARALIVDHRLQEGSDRVAARAAAQVRAMGLTAEVVAVDVPAGGDGTEAEARRVRYQALFHAAAARPVVVAHTRDDQAETLLLGALRGLPTGMSDRPGLLRPFLKVRRADTVGACRELGLAHWSDPHNGDPAFRRVAVRTRVLPLLAEITGADPVEALALAADRIAADDGYLTSLAGEPTDDCAELAAQAEPLRRRRIVAWLTGQGLAVNRAVLAGVDKLCTDWRGQGGVAVGQRDGRRLAVHRVGGKLALIPET